MISKDTALYLPLNNMIVVKSTDMRYNLCSHRNNFVAVSAGAGAIGLATVNLHTQLVLHRNHEWRSPGVAPGA
jgi:hypothetical protein